MQFTGKRNGIYFNWGSYQYDFDFLPRVVYKSIIFSPKTWNIRKVSIKPLIETLNKDAFKSEMNTWVHKLQLPEYVVLVDGDNELLITTRNVSSMEMLINTIKRLARFVLKEFLHSENTLVQSKNGNYVNQIILSFYNEKGHKNKAV
jgi:hypothetical protein